MGKRVNTVLQTCFFALSGVLPLDEAIVAIKGAIQHTYGKRGQAVVDRNVAAVDSALDGLQEVTAPVEGATLSAVAAPAIAGTDTLSRATAAMLAGRGETLPVSALPVDGTFPVGTARYEKRSIADEIPIWDPSICIDCAKCAIVCPHAAIRMKVFPAEHLDGAPEGFPTKDWRDKHLPGMKMTIQVAPDDCTGCGICVDTCPAHAKEAVGHRSINLEPKLDHLEVERERFDFFLSIPEIDRTLVDPATVKGSQMLEPLFEFSGACEGCGETPYLKVLTQLFGDRMLVANATGCSSIYGGNLPTTPWTANRDGHGPAWSNSLFEDNAEFGLGMRLALDAQELQARALVAELAPDLAALALRRRPAHRGGCRRAAPARGAAARAHRDRRSARGAPACGARRRTRPQERLDRRRRRLGVRHRLRRARPRPRLGTQRQRPRARHRGLLEHRRPGVEVHAARSGRQVRRRRKAERQEGSRSPRDLLRERLRRPHRARRRQPSDGQGSRGGRRMERAVARDRVQPLHRARDRDAEGHAPAEARRRHGLLAALALRPATRGPGRASVPARFPTRRSSR